MPTKAQNLEAIYSLVEGRRSVRGYLDRKVPTATIERLLSVASRAPSGNNNQPWTVHVVTGLAKARLTDAIMKARAGEIDEPTLEYQYYPDIWPPLHRERRRAVGWELYRHLGIEKGDRKSARAWHDQNFCFFGAPVGMILTIDRRLGLGALIDCGLFIEGLAIAARASGLDTCAQAAFCGYHAEIRKTLLFAETEMVVCGIALGWEDPTSPANALRTERASVHEFARFHTI